MKQFAIVTNDKNTDPRVIHYFLKGTLVEVREMDAPHAVGARSVGNVADACGYTKGTGTLSQTVHLGDVLYLDRAACAAIEAELA